MLELSSQRTCCITDVSDNRRSWYSGHTFKYFKVQKTKKTHAKRHCCQLGAHGLDKLLRNKENTVFMYCWYKNTIYSKEIAPNRTQSIPRRSHRLADIALNKDTTHTTHTTHRTTFVYLVYSQCDHYIC